MTTPSPACFLYLPPEIVYLIFQHLDGKSFLKCRLVCRQWKAIADNIGQDPELWKRFCQIDYKYLHKSVARKCSLSWYNIYKNIQLWSKIKFAQEQQSLQFTPTDTFIKTMHVADELLIVVCEISVKFYKLENMFLKKYILGRYNDWQQNEHMTLANSTSATANRGLVLYGKSSPTAGLEQQNSIEIENTFTSPDLYRMEDNCFYFVNTKFELWGCRWENNTWKQVFFARYYGCNAIKCLNITCGEVYVLTRAGAILKLVTELKQFVKIESAWFPSYACTPAFLVNKCDIVYSTSADTSFHSRTDRQRIEVECPNLSCLVVQANMLIIGTTQGEVEIYSWDNLRVTPKPERVITIKSMETPSAIIALDVKEGEDEHSIYMCTSRSVYKVRYTHAYLEASHRVWKVERHQCDY